jgi:uncharacterized membrane protein
MRSRWLGFLIVGLAAVISAWAYPRLPINVATHWNLSGEPSGYSSRLVAVLLVPTVVLLLSSVLRIVPRLYRQRDRSGLIDIFWLILNTIFLFLLAIHVVVIGNGVGAPIRVGQLIPIGIGILFVLLGGILGSVKPNQFLGIRTPWTVSSERVWYKTHRTGQWLFAAAGLLLVVSSFAPRITTFAILVPILVVVVVTLVAQSYILWTREQSGAND